MAALSAFFAEDVAPPEFEQALDHVELVRSDSDAQIIAYDGDGDVIGTIALWVEDDGRIILASDYADGYAETVMSDGRASTESSLPPEIIERRADAISLELDIAGPDVGPQEGKWGCAISTVSVVLACATPAWGCPFALYGAACACLPLAMKDFQCPGNR